MVIWLTGFSGAGKSTIGVSLRESLSQKMRVKLLDGDEIRAGLNQDLDFSLKGRAENIRRVAHLAKLFQSSGFLVICCFISPTAQIREMARDIIGETNFYEVFIDASLKSCEERDVKGLYQKARAGNILNFTGIDTPYEAPISPSLVLDTEQFNSEECTAILVKRINSILSSKKSCR